MMRPDRLRLSCEDSPIRADRIEFTTGGLLATLCYGLVVLVPLLSTPPCGGAVTVRFRTALHRTEPDFHCSVFPLSQARERRKQGMQLPRRDNGAPIRRISAVYEIPFRVATKQTG